MIVAPRLASRMHLAYGCGPMMVALGHEDRDHRLVMRLIRVVLALAGLALVATGTGPGHTHSRTGGRPVQRRLPAR